MCSSFDLNSHQSAKLLLQLTRLSDITHIAKQITFICNQDCKVSINFHFDNIFCFERIYRIAFNAFLTIFEWGNITLSRVITPSYELIAILTCWRSARKVIQYDKSTTFFHLGTLPSSELHIKVNYNYFNAAISHKLSIVCTRMVTKLWALGYIKAFMNTDTYNFYFHIIIMFPKNVNIQNKGKRIACLIFIPKLNLYLFILNI